MALWSCKLKACSGVEFSMFKMISLLDESFVYCVWLPIDIILLSWESFNTKYFKSFWRFVEIVHQFFNLKSFSTMIFLLSTIVSVGLFMRQDLCFCVLILSLVFKLVNKKFLLSSNVLLLIVDEVFWSLSYDAMLLYSSSRSPICLFLVS